MTLLNIYIYTRTHIHAHGCTQLVMVRTDAIRHTAKVDVKCIAVDIMPISRTGYLAVVLRPSFPMVTITSSMMMSCLVDPVGA